VGCLKQNKTGGIWGNGVLYSLTAPCVCVYISVKTTRNKHIYLSIDTSGTSLSRTAQKIDPFKPLQHTTLAPNGLKDGLNNSTKRTCILSQPPTNILKAVVQTIRIITLHELQ